MVTTKFWSSNKNSLTSVGIVGGVLAAVLVVSSAFLYLYAIRPGIELMADINSIKSDVAQLQTATISRDLVAVEKLLAVTESDLKTLRQSRDTKFAWARDFGPTKEYFSDTENFINAGLYAIDAGREAVNLVKPFADAAGFKVKEEDKPKETKLMDAFSTWISIMPKVAADSDVFLEKLSKVGDELANVNTSKYPQELNGIPLRATIEVAKNSLTQVNDYAPDIKTALQIIPGLMGVGTGEKRYMIIMQNDKEIRATGGFWTNYATFKLRNALLNSDFTSKDMYSIDFVLNKIDSYFTFPKVPPAYQKYLKVERMFTRDANISPDYPTSLDQFMYLYKIASRVAPAEIKAVDGIFTIDTNVISELLGVTGAVTVNGVTYDSNNVVLELEKIASLELREQAGRKGVLGQLMGRMLVNVFESDKNLWTVLIEKGVDLATRKHIQAYVFDPTAQALLEKYNFAGRIIEPVDGDYSYVVQTNLGGDKTNWFVKKSVDHNIAQENGKWTHTVKISYSYPQPSAEFGPFIKRFRDWIRVYAPKGSTLVGVTGSEDGSQTAEERNKTYFTGYIELGPTETKEVTYKYTLPDGLVKNGVYTLYLQKQSGITSEVHTITVNGKADKIELIRDVKYSKKI